MLRIRDGFVGQRLVVYPFYVIESALSNPLTADLAVHSMGYFNHAEGHYIDRPNGCGEYLLIYCVRGRGGYELYGKEHQVGENQFFILPADMPHRYWADAQEPWSIYWAHFKGAKAVQVYKRLTGLRTIDPGDTSRLRDRADFFDELLNVMESGTDDEAVQYVNMSFSHLLSTFLFIAQYREARYHKTKAESAYFISLATHYMNEHLDRQLSLEDMASHFGYSKSYFYRLFYKETQYSPVAYFQHIKMKWAADMLTNTNLKVNQVAMKLGFDDPYYFSRLFKKVIGMSPLYYKRSKQ